MPESHSSSWNSSLQTEYHMKDARQGEWSLASFQWMGLSSAHITHLPLQTAESHPTKLDCAKHVPMHPQALQQAPRKVDLTGWREVRKIL